MNRTRHPDDNVWSNRAKFLWITSVVTHRRDRRDGWWPRYFLLFGSHSLFIADSLSPANHVNINLLYLRANVKTDENLKTNLNWIRVSCSRAKDTKLLIFSNLFTTTSRYRLRESALRSNAALECWTGANNTTHHTSPRRSRWEKRCSHANGVYGGKRSKKRKKIAESSVFFLVWWSWTFFCFCCGSFLCLAKHSTMCVKPSPTCDASSCKSPPKLWLNRHRDVAVRANYQTRVIDSLCNFSLLPITSQNAAD